MEVEPRDGHATERHGFDVLDPVHRRGERPLTYSDDPILHLDRRQPGVTPDDGDDRNVDAGEDVGRHGHDRQDAQDGDQQGQYDERVGPAECEAYNPHNVPLDYMTKICMRAPDYLPRCASFVSPSASTVVMSPCNCRAR